MMNILLLVGFLCCGAQNLYANLTKSQEILKNIETNKTALFKDNLKNAQSLLDKGRLHFADLVEMQFYTLTQNDLFATGTQKSNYVSQYRMGAFLDLKMPVSFGLEYGYTGKNRKLTYNPAGKKKNFNQYAVGIAYRF
jgi:hypothetical protein